MTIADWVSRTDPGAHGPKLSSMSGFDWIQLIGIATLLVSVGMLCIVFFAI
jgi:hypothetical protein